MRAALVQNLSIRIDRKSLCRFILNLFLKRLIYFLNILKLNYTGNLSKRTNLCPLALVKLLDILCYILINLHDLLHKP